MKKELLYRFFEGGTSDKEDNAIKAWLEASPENRQSFLDERLVYDTVLLNTPDNFQPKNKPLTLSLKWVSTIAAAFLILIVGGLYLLNTYNSRSVGFNTILVPPGQRINLILSDNSNVWLNANSTFRYPSQFARNNRTVYLDGEGFFEVKSNRKSPFVVETGYGEVRATGTSFNVEAYTKYEQFEATLFSGIIEVQAADQETVILSPDQSVALKNGILAVNGIEDHDKFLWRNGLIVFNHDKLEDILTSLEKYFDVEMQIDTKHLPEHTYTGKFRQSDGVDYALRVLQRSIAFSYTRNADTGKIHIN